MKQFPLAVVAFIVLVGTAVLFTVRFDRQQRFGFAHDGDVVRIQDFASNRQFARSWWAAGAVRHTGPSPYSVESHVAMMVEWVGSRVSDALPFVYPPTMLLLLAPFAALPASWAFMLWSALGAAAAARIVGRQARYPVAALTIFVAPLSMATIALGQTALVTTMALFILMATHRTDGFTLQVLALVLLSVKPPLALTAAVALLACGRPGVVAAGAAVCLSIAAAFTAVAGPGWLWDYPRLLLEYNRSAVDPVFAIGLVPQQMTNLRGLLHAHFGVDDAVASFESAVVWLLVVGGVAAVALRGRLRRSGVWACLLMAYLLLCPHVSFTEDLALVLVLGTLPVHRNPNAGRVAAAAAVAAVLLSPRFGPIAGAGAPVAFAFKVVIAALVGWLAVRERSGSAGGDMGDEEIHPPVWASARVRHGA